MKLTSIAMAIAMISLSSCTYDALEDSDLSPDDCLSREVSYTVDINPILELSCSSCHNSGFNSGGVSLDSYEAVKDVADSGRLLGSIKHERGFSAMPRGAAQFDDCTISLFEDWITQGAPNN